MDGLEDLPSTGDDEVSKSTRKKTSSDDKSNSRSKKKISDDASVKSSKSKSSKRAESPKPDTKEPSQGILSGTNLSVPSNNEGFENGVPNGNSVRSSELEQELMGRAKAEGAK